MLFLFIYILSHRPWECISLFDLVYHYLRVSLGNLCWLLPLRLVLLQQVGLSVGSYRGKLSITHVLKLYLTLEQISLYKLLRLILGCVVGGFPESSWLLQFSAS